MRKIIHVDMGFVLRFRRGARQPRTERQADGSGLVGPRGVVLTANYAARAYKVHSALPTSLALKRYPELRLLPPRMNAYKEVSGQIHEVFRHYTEVIEPLSLDEAYLDVSHVKGDSSTATTLAKSLKRDILKETKLTASASVSLNF
jgi:DNA polymerase IV